MLLLDHKIITEQYINSPVQIDPNVLNELPKKVKNRLKTTTMLDIMTHMSGIKDYLKKYLEQLETNNKICPIEPEDFIEYIDDNVNKKGIYHYSNAGILLCGLSIKYLYNKNKGTNKNYNEILHEYIIEPAKLKTFSIDPKMVPLIRKIKCQNL
jgi:CubicO group peptidase (beta-lactamase class C family)